MPPGVRGTSHRSDRVFADPITVMSTDCPPGTGPRSIVAAFGGNPATCLSKIVWVPPEPSAAVCFRFVFLEAEA